MITELALTGIIFTAYRYLCTKDERKLKNDFEDIMRKIGIKNKEEETFRIYKIINTRYGYKAYISIPNGLSIKHLEDKINILEDNLNSIIQIKKEKFNSTVTLFAVNKDITKFMFSPVKQKPNQLWIGKNIRGQDYFIDLNKDPMILICGKTGYGKTMLLSSILSNLIYNCPKDIELWITQTLKGELHSFDNCNQVKLAAYNYMDVMVAIQEVKTRLDRRSKLFEQQGIRNITQWNQHFPRKKMKRIILVCEEMSDLIEYDDLWDKLWTIAKAGRSVGIHLIGCMQRITATNINTNVRSQMTKITFKQNSEADSHLTIGSLSAMDLQQGECLVGIDGEQLIKVPFIDDDFVVLNKYIPEIKIPSEEIKQEVTNIKKISDNKIEITETPEIIDVPISHIKPKDKVKKKKGVISWEEIQNAYRKG